jgi:hypothetical protein
MTQHPSSSPKPRQPAAASSPACAAPQPKPARPSVPRLSVESKDAAAHPPRQLSPAIAHAPDPALDRKIKLAIAAGAGLLTLLALIIGAAPTKIVAVLICLLTLQGLWRGAGELIGLVTSTLFAVVFAPPLGRGFESVFNSIFRTGGVLGRGISIAIIGLLIIAAGTTFISIAARRFLKKRPQFDRWNSYVGAGLGAIEGTILGMAVLWTVLALEPIAAGQIAAAKQPAFIISEPESKPSPLAEGIVAFSGRIRDSALGGTAQATNPIEGARLLTVCDDFTAIVHDEEAFDYFISTPVVQEIKQLPSINTALERVKADAQLNSLFNDQDVTADSIRTLLESKTVLDVFDHTTVVADLTPRMDAMIEAIAQAKARIGPPPELPAGRKPAPRK